MSSRLSLRLEIKHCSDSEFLMQLVTVTYPLLRNTIYQASHTMSTLFASLNTSWISSMCVIKPYVIFCAMTAQCCGATGFTDNLVPAR